MKEQIVWKNGQGFVIETTEKHEHHEERQATEQGT